MRAVPLVAAVVVLTMLAGSAVWAFGGDITASQVTHAIALTALGIAAEFFSYNQSREASGSIALIPFTSAALVAPTWVAIACIIVSQAIVQLLHRRSGLKTVFNVAQITLGIAVGIIAFRLTGGVPFGALRDTGFIAYVGRVLLPSTLLIGSLIIVNTLCVSAAVSLTSRRPVLEVWANITKATAPLSVLIVLFSFYLSWLTTELGLPGMVGMALPMVAVRQLYKTTIELTNVTEELLDLMVAAIEARDPYTSGHSRRVAQASKIIATALNLPTAKIERVEVAALLHDVGKIDEAFAPVLAKAGRLTPEEWALMKRHPIRSAELVGLLSSLKDLVAPVRHHHENWDGSGYPDALKGDAIPLASRIIMFADTLDAITTDRPYRKALSMEDARSEFIKFRGRQFDPGICDVVVSPEVWEKLYRSLARPSVVPRKTLAS